MTTFIRRAAALACLAFLFPVTAEAQSRPSLLGSSRGLPPEQRGADAIRVNPTRGLERQRQVKPDLKVLDNVRGSLERRPGIPVEIEIPVFDDVTFVVKIERFERARKGVVAYYGSIVGIPMSAATLVDSNGTLAGNLNAFGRTYQIVSTGDGLYRAQEIDPSKIVDHARPVPEPPPLPAMKAEVQADDGSTIDLLVVYTADALAGAGSQAAMDSQIDLAVAVTNQAYQASGVVQRLRLVHSELVAYTETHDMSVDLSRLSNKDPATGASIAPDGYLDNVQTLRNSYGADLVSLWVEDGGGTAAGLGWLMTSVSNAFESYGYNVVLRSAAASNLTLAHELGHNMGLRHDAYMDTGSTPYAWAHGYVDLANRFRTVMAYNNQCTATAPGTSCTRITSFSSPLYTYNGAVVGTAAGADAARVLNDTRTTVANFRAAVPDAGQVEARLGTVSIGENGGTLNISVARLGGSVGAASVAWATTNGTGSAGTEFGTFGNPAQLSGTLNWADADTADKTISIPIIDDLVADGPKTFTVTLSGATGAVLGSTSTVSVTVTDNEPDAFPAGCAAPSGWTTPAGATTGWGVTSETSVEGSCSFKSQPMSNPPTTEPGCTTGTILYSKAQTQFTGTFLNGNITFSARTSSEGQYDCLHMTVDGVEKNIGSCSGNAASPLGLTAAGGATDSGWQNFSIPVTAGSHTVRFSYEADCYAAGANAAYVDNLAMPIDPTSVPTLNFSQPTYQVTESGPVINVQVTRSGPSVGAIGVTWTTANGTAIAGQDFGTAGNAAQRTGTLSWASGDATAKTITVGPAGLVPVINDSTIEAAETFDIVLSAPTGGAAIGATGTTTVTINDDESTINFDVSSISVSEGGPNATVTLTRTGSTLTTATVTLTTAPGTALATSDYTAVSQVVTFGPGVTSQTVTLGPVAAAAPYVPIVNDAVIEGPETFTLSIGTPTGGAIIGGTSTVTVTINSDDKGIAMGGATLSVAENAGTAQVPVNRTGSTAGAISVNYAFTNGTALNGTNYTGTAGTLNWADGDGAVKYIGVPILDDTVVNANRTFTVTLSGAVGAALGTPASTAVTIADNDNTVQFNLATATVAESTANVVLTVTRLGGAAGAASVDWATVNGTATAGADFTGGGGTLTWAPGDATSKTITIPILPDALIEGNETFTVALSNPTGTGTSVGAIATATVTITDDDSGVSFAQPTYSVIEGGPMLTVQVNRIGNTANPIGVTWTTANGTAVAGQDFGTAGNAAQRTGTLSWLAGDAAAKTITVGLGGLVPIIDDTTFEATENFTITLSAPTGGASLGPQPTTTVNITDNESTIEFASPTVGVAEGGPNVTLAINRTGSTALAQSVVVTPANGTAVMTSDWTGAVNTVTFAAGETSKLVTFGPSTVAGPAPYYGIVNDAVIEGPETFTLTLSGGTAGAQLGATKVATVTIDSDDKGIAMGGATLSVAENAGTAQVPVSRAGPPTGAISVNYAFTNGTALNGTHYTGTAGTLNWADGDGAVKYISVPILDDTLVNANRSFTVTLSGAVGATLGTPASTAVTIADNDNTLQFSAATASVSEATGNLVLTVTRLGGAAGAAGITWTTANGTAISGSDFGVGGNAAQVTGTLAWAPGDATSKTITIPILQDALIEGNETFTVTLSAPTGTGTSVGAIATATVTITDDDSGVSFAQPTYSVIEGGPMLTVQVNRIGNTANPIGVTWTTANGTAVAGQDFGTAGNAAQRTGTLSWLAGDAAAKTITVGLGGLVPIIDDTTFEATENFTITLSAPTGGAQLGPQPTTTVNITDNESTIEFASAGIAVSETGPNVALQVTRTGSTALAQTVTYTPASGTAVAGADWSGLAGTITFAAGETSKVINIGPTAAAAPYIAIINDAVIEGPETFTITLASPSAGGQLGATKVATVTIDSDDKGIAMGGATLSVAENAGTAQIPVSRAGSPTGAISVNYAFTNGTALNGSHYTGTPGTLNWADGDGTVKYISVPILDDTIVNANRGFTVTLSGAVGATLGTPASTAVTIADNDNTLQFSAATASVTEGTPNLVLTVTRLGGAAGPATVNWATADGTAISGSDFGTPGPSVPVTGVLSWAAGDATSKTITIPIIDDAIVEGTKTFTVTLSAPTGTGTSLGGVTTSTVTLVDNDAGLVFSQATYLVSESTASIALTVNRIGPSTSVATVNWSTANGTATAGQDFGTSGSALQRSGTLSWIAGDATSKTILIPIINDVVAEGFESFTVTLSSPSAGIVLGSPSVATVVIADDESPPDSTVEFSAAKYVAMEGVTPLTLTITRSGAATYPASVSFSMQPGTASAGLDYTASSGTLTWGAGDLSSRTINVPILNDAVAENPEQFTVTLASVSAGAGLGANSKATVLIMDDDEDFPPDGAIPAGWVVPVAATKGWHVSNDPGAFAGSYSLKSDEIDDGQAAQVEVSGTFAAGNVTFQVKVSSEPGFDFLRFYVDGVKKGEWSGTAIAGWQAATVPITAGIHTLRWSYEKDATATVGQDAAWIDAVVTPAMTP